MRASVVALTAPVLAGTILTTMFITLELAGVTPPLSLAAPRNIAEAAGMGSAADVQRFLDLGADPARQHAIGPDVVSSDIRLATALEAAIWSRRVELVQLLESHSRLDPASRAQLACLARELRTEDIYEYLSAGTAVECSGSVSERIAARGR